MSINRTTAGREHFLGEGHNLLIRPHVVSDEVVLEVQPAREGATEGYARFTPEAAKRVAERLLAAAGVTSKPAPEPARDEQLVKAEAYKELLDQLSYDDCSVSAVTCALHVLGYLPQRTVTFEVQAEDVTF